MAQAGGTNDVIIADTTASLKTQLKAAISNYSSQIIITAPAISQQLKKVETCTKHNLNTNKIKNGQELNKNRNRWSRKCYCRRFCNECS